MIDEKLLLKELERWAQDDLYPPRYFKRLIEAQPKVQINILNKVSRRAHEFKSKNKQQGKFKREG